MKASGNSTKNISERSSNDFSVTPSLSSLASIRPVLVCPHESFPEAALLDHDRKLPVAGPYRSLWIFIGPDRPSASDEDLAEEDDLSVTPSTSD